MSCICQELDDLRRRTMDTRQAVLSSVFTDSRGGHTVDWGTKQCREYSKVNTSAEQMQSLLLLGMADALLAAIPLMQEMQKMLRILAAQSAAP